MGIVHKVIGQGSNLDWEGVPGKHYETGDMKGGIKRILLGPEDGSNNFRLRYFRVQPGGHSRKEHLPVTSSTSPATSCTSSHRSVTSRSASCVLSRAGRLTDPSTRYHGQHDM
jgi:hypothetical protein